MNPTNSSLEHAICSTSYCNFFHTLKIQFPFFARCNIKDDRNTSQNVTFVKTHVVVCLGLAGNWLSSRASSKRKQATKETLMRRSFAKKNALLLTYMKKSLFSSYIIIIHLPFQLVSSKQWRPDTYCISKVSVCSDFQTLGKPKFQNVQHNFLFSLFRTTFWKGLEGGVCCPLWGQFSYLVSRSRPKWTRGRHSPQGRSRNVGSRTGKCICLVFFLLLRASREKASLTKVF